MFIRVALLVEYKAFVIQSLCSLKGKVRFLGSALIFEKCGSLRINDTVGNPMMSTYLSLLYVTLCVYQ